LQQVATKKREKTMKILVDDKLRSLTMMELAKKHSELLVFKKRLQSASVRESTRSELLGQVDRAESILLQAFSDKMDQERAAKVDRLLCLTPLGRLARAR
jgi:hypothetical protein